MVMFDFLRMQKLHKEDQVDEDQKREEVNLFNQVLKQRVEDFVEHKGCGSPQPFKVKQKFEYKFELNYGHEISENLKVRISRDFKAFVFADNVE